MTEPELIAIDLTDEERELVFIALNEYGVSAKYAYRLLCPVLGRSTEDEWYQLTSRLGESVKNQAPLSDLDWARALFLTEISFGSNLVGSGLDFGPAADEYWLGVLRSLQRKVSSYARFLLLLQNASYPAVE